MKKLILIISLGIFLAGCSASEKSGESSSEISEAVTKSSEEVTTTETVSMTTAEAFKEEQTEPPTSNYQNEYPKVEELNLEAPSEIDLMNRRRKIFPTDNGYYYYGYLGGRDSANFALGFDSGDGNFVPFKECEDCVWYFMNEGIIYGFQMKLHDNGKMNICKFENGSVVPIIELSCYSEIFFDSEYIYYIKYQNGDANFYRADYNGENIEYIFTADDSHIEKFIVYDDKICYNDLKNYYNDLRIYDMNSGELTELSDVKAGRINGGYMYYVGENGRLMRMNLEDYSIEFVWKAVVDFEFCGDKLIRSDFQNIYTLQNGEEKLIFNVSEFFDDGYNYYIDYIQVEGERLFIDISSCPYYSYIAELDIDGNFIRKYYENKGA